MKRLLYIFVSFFFLTLGGCSLLETYGLMDGNNSKGDSDLEEQLDSLKTRVLVLEAIMNAYESNLMITSIVETDDGYAIVFTDGSSAVIRNGQDGKDGADGQDGKGGDSYVKEIQVGDLSVTFVLSDGTSFEIPLYSSLSLSFEQGDLVVMEPEGTREIRYFVESRIEDVTVECLSSEDIKAEVMQDSPFSGMIRIRTGAVIDRYSKVVVFASNGEKMVMKTLRFEEEAIEVVETTEKEVTSSGGELELEYMSNVECEVFIPQEAQSWISVAPASKDMTRRSIILILQANTTPVARTAEVTVSGGDAAALTFTITQDAALTEDEGSENEKNSADGKVVVLQKATEGNGIDVVLLGDAYTERLIADETYEADMRYLYDNLFIKEPFKTYKNLFNVYYVNVVSENEGYGNGATALGGKFGEGTLVEGNMEACFGYALNAIDDERMNEALLIVAMNSDRYAGTCWMYYSGGEGDYGNGPSIAYFPKGGDKETFAQLLHHEANGHGFAKLADEYAYDALGVIPSDYVEEYRMMQETYGWWKNVDFTSDPEQVRWSYFLDDSRYANDGLGVFEGGLTYSGGVWRPTENSIMRYNVGDFNAPSREAIYYRIHKLAYGDSWQYNYEDFVKYDVVNRSATASLAARPNYVERAYEPTSPPVVVRRYWKDAK